MDLRPLEQTLLWKLDHDEIWLWDDDGPKAMAAAPRPAAGVSRIHLVYTPLEHRALGLGSAVTAAGPPATYSPPAPPTAPSSPTSATPPATPSTSSSASAPIAEYLNVTFGPHP